MLSNLPRAFKSRTHVGRFSVGETVTNCGKSADAEDTKRTRPRDNASASYRKVIMTNAFGSGGVAETSVQQEEIPGDSLRGIRVSSRKRNYFLPTIDWVFLYHFLTTS